MSSPARPINAVYALRVWYEVLGGHTHISIFSGKRGCTLGKCGDICMTNDEFTAWRENTIAMEFKEVPKKKEGD